VSEPYPGVLDCLKTAFAEILDAWGCELLEFGAGAERCALAGGIHPALRWRQRMPEPAASTSP